MRHLFICIFMSLMAGCQLIESVGTPLTSGQGTPTEACPVTDSDIIEWLKLEHRYISSTLESKQQLLIDAEKRQQKILHALLLSAPGQSFEQLDRAYGILIQLQDAHPDCSYSHYLNVRTRQLRLQLDLQRRHDALAVQTDELQRQVDALTDQVDALTDLERQITRQREEH
ncbi:hypothetical protein [Marinobacterium weihaiense]|uniref:Lipoprotein n=1 Tax=Marinobacterium weihaiense TaxID=2851016 RepID=A0ABS6M964_9GAMM|nr:hypothetical protein [Marinobacterium weihaiense]MBV0932826.1 hypothetical protein [Marinobacterium weihaiense]